MAACAALLAAVCALAFGYSEQERFLYFWDWAGFHAIAVEFAEQLRADWRAGIATFRRSMEGEYNLVFAWPLLPVLLATEGARTPYIVAIAGLYLTPFAVVTGIVSRRAFPELGRIALWGGAVLAVVVPPVWGSVMRGYPDVIGAALILGALALVMGDLALDRWRTPVLAGFLLALAVIVRRHLLFAALSVLGTAGLLWLRHQLDLRGVAARSAAWRRLLRALALPAAAGGFLALLHPDYLVRLAENDYWSLYASYQRPPLDFLAFLRGRLLGVVPFAVAGVGLVLGLVRGGLGSTARAALTLYGLLWLAGWIAIVRQDGPHQLVAGVPILVIAGVLQVADLARARAGRRALALWTTLALGYAVLAAVVVHAPSRAGYAAVQQVLPILPRYEGPLRRDDFEAVRALIATLREGPQPVVIAASNGVLNFDLVHKAEPRLFGRDDRRIAVLASPQIDSRDPLPVDDLLRAEQIVIVTPFQYHLPRPTEQDVVRVLLDAFAESWPVAQDFRELTPSFALERGSVARVYRRERPSTLDTALDTYERVVAVTGDPPPRYRDVWFWFGAPNPPGVAYDAGGRVSVYQLGPGDDEEVGLTLLRALEGAHRVEGRAEPGGPACAGMQLEAVDLASGAVYGTASVPAGAKTPFAFEGHPEGPARVRLVARSHERGRCSLNLVDLRVVPVASLAGGE